MKAEELAVIKERAGKANGESWLYNRHNEILTGRGARLAQVVCGTDAEFIAHAREDVPKLVAEVERLRKAIDNAISLLPDGENRLANRHLCEALEVDEDIYGFYSGGDE